MNNIKKYLLILGGIFLLSACANRDSVIQNNNIKDNKNNNTQNNNNKNDDIQDSNIEEDNIIIDENLIISDGMTLAERIKEPNGYKRIEASEDSFISYLRNFKLKPDKSKVLLYDGSEKSNQDAHIAIFDIDVGDEDLQQCADSIIRVYSEYFWSIGQYDKIKFHLTNGFLMEYTKWRDGNRLVVDNDNVSWNLTNEYDNSYDNFKSYLRQIFIYSGTLSLDSECKAISIDEINVGDMFIKGGSPGHCVMIVDIAQNSKGKKCFLLAQGYMPAQEFHILKNIKHKNNPWYYEEEIVYPFKTPEYTFQDGELKHWTLW